MNHINNLATNTEIKNIVEFSKNKKTPFLVINLEDIEHKYDLLKTSLPFAKIYYAVKSNPEPDVIKIISQKGSYFDVATIYEIKELLKLGISPDKMSFGNTIKKGEDISFAYKKGIRLFASDSISDLEKIANNAPDSKVFFRLLCENTGAEWPLSKKFGATEETIKELILSSKSMNINPCGLSFHVGSQQRQIDQWDKVLSKCKEIFDFAEENNVNLNLINMGGGFPAQYINPIESTTKYASKITSYLKKYFGKNLPEIITEPGRSLCGESGIIISEIVLISDKTKKDKWVYLDIGKFGGLIETLDESIKYPIYTEKELLGINSKTRTEVILAGPTCDSMDTLYEKMRYTLPSDIKEGDRVYIMSTGAYTKSYSSICFNGIPPLKSYNVKSLKK